jgi:N-acetylglucosaminyldiphosphoundecaprenol N-acetyl-beta-D-mannosaminyltransferase
MTRDDLIKYAQRARVNFLDCSLDALSMSETLEIVELAIREQTQIQHVVVNVAKLVSMRQNPVLRSDVMESDIVNVDGMGVVFGCRLFGIHIPERVSGIDLMQAILDRCTREGWRPYFLGARQDVLTTAMMKVKQRYPGIEIAGYHHGYFGESEEDTIVKAIRSARPDLLFVAISSPKKERFVRRWREMFDVPVVMGVGGSIDVIAGLVRRAPAWMQMTGLEWLYRLAQEPRRMWRRYLSTNLAYAWILTTKMVGHKRPSSR